METPINDTGDCFQQPDAVEDFHQQQQYSPQQQQQQPTQQIFYAREPPPPQSAIPVLDKPTYIIIFVAFLLGFFMGKTQPVILRSS